MNALVEEPKLNGEHRATMATWSFENELYDIRKIAKRPQVYELAAAEAVFLKERGYLPTQP